MDRQISVVSVQTHHCGQTFEERITFKMDEAFEQEMNIPLPELLPIEGWCSFPTFDDTPPVVTITIKGHVEQANYQGFEARENEGFFCPKCGENLLQSKGKDK